MAAHFRVTLGLALAAIAGGAAWLGVEAQRRPETVPAPSPAQFRAVAPVLPALAAPAATPVPFEVVPAAKAVPRSQQPDRTPQRSFARYPQHSGR